MGMHARHPAEHNQPSPSGDDGGDDGEEWWLWQKNNWGASTDEQIEQNASKSSASL